MHKFVTFITLLLSVFCANYTSAQGPVYILSVDTEIDNSAFRHFHRGLDEAQQAGATMLVVHLNTYGGALDAADSIRTALLRLKIPTVAFVDVNAASAGALIALACDSVFMAPGASMGSATVVNGAGEPMPEKYQSYMSTIMRATAEHHGMKQQGDSLVWRRDPAIAASMVNPSESVSLTTTQALACGYADGRARNVSEVLEQLGRADSTVINYNSGMADSILGFLSNAAVRAILVMLILGGIYMEMHTPGLGFAAAVASVATILYLLPMIVTGTISAWVLILLIAGVVLIALEVFVIPGFGVAGISGILCVGTALVGVLTTNDAITGFDASSIGSALAVVGSGAILALIVVWYLTSSHGPKCLRKHSELMTELSVADGFIGVDMQPAALVGKHGVAATVLRPAGKVEVGNNIYDAVSQGEFISAGRHVKIVKYENAQLYVVEIPNKDEHK